MSIDALQSLGNSAQTKASDHLINIESEHNSKRYERLVGLYHGCESMEKHVLHYGDTRMGPFYGSDIQQHNATFLRPRKQGMVTEMEHMSMNGYTISTGSMARMIKWQKLNSQVSQDGRSFC